MSAFLSSRLLRTSAPSSSSLPSLNRSIKHVAKRPHLPKYKQAMHPSAWTKTLDSGALLVYNPPPSAPSDRSTNVLEKAEGALRGPTRKILPSSWKIEEGFGHMAPRIDRRPEGTTPSPRVEIPEEIKKEIRSLREEDPEQWTARALSKKYNIEIYMISEIARAPRAYIKDMKQTRSLIKERLPLKKLLKHEAKQIRKSFW
ncbi:Ribosomal protein L20, mitochondrial [Phaffia rhodozyma]|uniref:Ribosomal protein L20, mitochondrial n=1 Tax=Phaffia rhodozyma TaxID=264483 RepID=A0A0F7SJE0_PHARH|nr:Ribosomal protein L20, mitochondrial [Phaffia rhodozyma]